MDWLILIFVIPLILIPIVLLCGFAGCGVLLGASDDDGVAAPSNLNATAGGTDLVNLSWQNNAGAGYVFFVDRGPPGGLLLPIANNVNATTFSNSGLTEGTTFLYQVRAIATSGGAASSPSNVATVTTFPATPTNLVATVTDASHVQLGWNNASANADTISLEQRSSPGSPWNEIYKGPKTPVAPPTASITPAGNDEFRVTSIVSNGFDNSVSKEVRSNPSAPVPITGPVWKPSYSVPLTTDDPAGWGGNTIVQMIFSGSLTKAGTKVRITLRAPTAANLVINKIAISQQAVGMQAWDSAADLVEVLFAGASGVTIPATQPATSDVTNYTLVLGKNLIIAFDISPTTGSLKRAVGGASNMYSKKNTAEATVQNRSGNYLTNIGLVYIVETIEVA